MSASDAGGLGRRRPCGRWLRCSLRLGARAWIGCRLRWQTVRGTPCRTRSEGCAVGRRVGSPGRARGANWAPKRSACPPAVRRRLHRDRCVARSGVSWWSWLSCDSASHGLSAVLMVQAAGHGGLEYHLDSVEVSILSGAMRPSGPWPLGGSAGASVVAPTSCCRRFRAPPTRRFSSTAATAMTIARTTALVS